MQFDQLKRRELITVLGGVTAWPLAARAQQPAMPVIGFLHPASFSGLSRACIPPGIEGSGLRRGRECRRRIPLGRQSDGIGCRSWPPSLVRQKVAVLAVTANPSVLAAQAATRTIPIVFIVAADDPVRLGFVASLARPGGNLTGFNVLFAELAAKRMELLHNLVPGPAASLCSSIRPRVWQQFHLASGGGCAGHGHANPGSSTEKGLLLLHMEIFLGRCLDQFREKVQSLQADTGLYAVRSSPVIVCWSTAPRG